ncbi:glycosyltransferase family 39 protein [Patescibacteria group bacterium]|nr:glycosyltransferase family 39 protein [Patescibacteria group bacterium]
MRAALRDRLAAFLKTHRTETAIFLIVFAAHAFFAVVSQLHFGEHVFVSYSDAFYFYYQSALNLLHHGTLSIAQQAPFFPDAYHTPLYSLFIAALLAVQLPLFGIVITQNILIALTAVLVYRIGMTLFSSNRIALVGALASGLDPMNLYWGNLLMSDTFFAFFCIAGFYLFIKKNYKSFALAMGLATLTRPLALYFFIPFLLFLPIRAFLENRDRINYAALGKTIVIMAILFMLMLAPWLIRNKAQFGTASLSTAASYELYTIVGASFAKTEHIAYPPAPVIGPGLSVTRFNFSYAAYYKTSFLSVVLAHPLDYAIFHLSATWASFWNHGYEYLVNEVILAKLPAWGSGLRYSLLLAAIAAGNLLWLLIDLFALYSIADGRTRLWWGLFTVLLALNLFAAGAINPSTGDMSRYMLPFTPLLFLFAAAGARNAFHTAAIRS